MTIGYNNVVVSAELNSGKTVETEIVIMNSCSANMDRVSVDLSDSDGDGLCNYYEDFLATDKNKPDTDGDGLSDFDEFIKTGTDPTNPDTDNNGILNGDESVFQILHQEIDTSKKEGVTNVSVSLECDGYINNRVSVFNTYDLDMRSSEVVGLVGVPIEIFTDAEFDTAEITFTYDESALGEYSEDNLCMMWYDEENDNYVLLEDSVLDKDANTVSYTTTHFSTYLIVDKQVWFDTMRMDMNYRNAGDITYYDLALVIDVSGSMAGTRMDTAKVALNTFVDAMMENDRAGIVKFESSATTVQALTSDRTVLKSRISTLSASGGTNANAGIVQGISLLSGEDSTNEKMLILLCDGSVSYNASTVASAKEKNITIHCINVVNGSSTAMERIADETGGTYYYATTAADVEKVISELKGDTVDSIDMTDSDGDGLYDVFEVNGMRLSNGQVVYTDPYNPDTDGDGVNDYDAMGGAPVVESYMFI